MNYEGDDWIFLKPIPLPKLLKRINKVLEKTTRLIAKVESEKLASTNNSRKIPSNATIREEYIRCGKSECTSEHGPYYYAYWKNDKGKLRKKCIGKYAPPVEKTNKSSRNDDDSASGDTVTNPSNSSEGMNDSQKLHKTNRNVTRKSPK